MQVLSTAGLVHIPTIPFRSKRGDRVRTPMRIKPKLGALKPRCAAMLSDAWPRGLVRRRWRAHSTCHHTCNENKGNRHTHRRLTSSPLPTQHTTHTHTHTERVCECRDDLIVFLQRLLYIFNVKRWKEPEPLRDEARGFAGCILDAWRSSCDGGQGTLSGSELESYLCGGATSDGACGRFVHSFTPY